MLKIVTGVLREVRLVSVRQLRALNIPLRYRKQATNSSNKKNVVFQEFL